MHECSFQWRCPLSHHHLLRLSPAVIEKKTRAKASRNIQHPYFHNLDYKAAEEFLTNKPRGEVIIRPSTKGKNHISITWKIDQGVYQHIGR